MFFGYPANWLALPITLLGAIAGVGVALACGLRQDQHLTPFLFIGISLTDIIYRRHKLMDLESGGYLLFPLWISSLLGLTVYLLQVWHILPDL